MCLMMVVGGQSIIGGSATNIIEAPDVKSKVYDSHRPDKVNNPPKERTLNNLPIIIVFFAVFFVPRRAHSSLCFLLEP